jgi:Family of unknown function (DUF6152)
MRSLQIVLMAAATVLAGGHFAEAHHSFAMFDHDHPVQLKGTLMEFKFTSPHTIVVITVKNADGSTTTWNLEGENAGTLIRAGWTRDSIKPGDELNMTILPLRSGAPAGSWDGKQISFGNGKPIVNGSH